MAVCLAVRAGASLLPIDRIEVAMAAASACAVLVLMDAWAREPEAIGRGCVKAAIAGSAVGLGAWLGA